MKKNITIIIVASVILNLISCDLLTKNLSKELAEWTAMVRVITPKDTDAVCAISPTEATIPLSDPTIEFELDNPYDFELETADLNTVLQFENEMKAETLVKELTHSVDNLTLSFKTSQVDASYEQGAQDLSFSFRPLHKEQNNRPSPTYHCTLHVNTRPPKAGDIVLGQKNGNYILCIPFEKSVMNAKYGSGKWLHDDITKIFIGTKSYELQFDGLTLESTHDHFSDNTDIAFFTGTSGGGLPDEYDNYVLYYDTGISTLDALPEYTVQLEDKGKARSQKTKSPSHNAVPIDGHVYSTDSNAWEKLKDMVENTSKNRIQIHGTIKAPSGASTITVNRHVLVEGKNGKNTDIIDANEQCRIFTVKKEGSNIGDLTLKNLSLQNGKVVDESGAGISVLEGTKCNIQNLVIKGCKAIRTPGTPGNLTSGGAIGVSSGTLTMTSCEIKNCTADSAGAIYINGGKAELDEVTIDHCTASNNGGGIDISSGTLTMNGGTITQCSGTQNSGAINHTDGECTLNNVAIYQCSVEGSNAVKGGAISFDEGSELTMNGGSIQNCYAKTTGSSSSANGGAIYAYVHGDLFLKGDLSISNCTVSALTSAEMAGAGLYISSYDGNVYISGGVHFDEMSDIYVPNDWSKPIIIEDNLTQPFVATITPSTYNTTDKVLEKGSTVSLAEQVKKFKIKDQDLGGGKTQKWTINPDGTIGMPKQTLNADDLASHEKWKKLREAVANAADGGTITINGEIYATADTGNFGEIEINKTLTIQGGSGAVINANCWYPSTPAHSVSGENHRIFRVKNGGKLTIETITLTGGYGNYGYGGAVFVTNNSTFIMNNGSIISGNKVKASSSSPQEKGGGVCVSGSTFIMNGGTISGNTIDESGSLGGGVYIGSMGVSSPSTFIMNGGTIKDNKATYGGGVYMPAGTFDMKGGTISDNHGTDGGSGVRVVNNGIFKMSGNAKVGGGSQNNTVWLDKDRVIKITGNLSASTAATIAPKSYPTAGSTVTVLSDNTGGNLVKANYRKFKVKDQTASGSSTQSWHIKNDGTLEKD